MLSKAFVFGLFVIVITYTYTKWRENQINEQERTILDAWNSSIKHPHRQFNRIIVGINCNLDLIVSGVDLLTSLKQQPGESLDSVSLNNIEDITNTFTHYFTKGSAAERPFTSRSIYRDIILTAEKLENKQHYVGGNAALMAVNIAELFPETKVELVGPIGPGLQNLLPASISVPQDSRIQDDEVHLIMEYGLNEKWEGLTSPVANRFITSYDESNSKLTMLDKFFTNLDAFSPDLILLSGLHLLESQSLSYVKEKIRKVTEGLSAISAKIPMHLELASMANGPVVKLIIDQVLPQVTSLGLNEQELTFSSHVAGGPHADYYTSRSGQPEIHKISDMVLWLLKTYGYSKTNTKSRLTRVHFHSLTYHIVGSLPGAWENSESAVAAGTRMAGRQACDTDKLSPIDIELRIPKTFKLFSGSEDYNLNEKNPVFSWEREGFQFVLSPVLVCISPSKTVGLGDAISATGLMYSEFLYNYNK